MSTRWHCHFELDYLLAQDDAHLAQILQGGTPVEMRVVLICKKAAGKKYLVVGDCDRLDAEGKCAGHPC